MSVCLSVTLCACAFRLRQEVLSRTSPQLVSLFTTCAFILVQVEVMKEGLAYTQLDWTRPPYEQQLQRLAVCKRLLLAVELSSGLEGAELCLQAVVMCYGVLAPLIQHQLMAPPLAKVWACVCVYIRIYVLYGPARACPGLHTDGVCMGPHVHCALRSYNTHVHCALRSYNTQAYCNNCIL